MKKGDSGDDVKKMQDRLIALGYLEKTTSDGIFGDAEEEAVKAFQAVYGLTETGVADSITLTVLYDQGAMEAPHYATLQKGDKGEEVKALQQRLIDKGWLNDSADGSYGGKTEDAVMRFQNAVGLPTTGIADEQTQRKLYANSAPDGRRYGSIAHPLADQDYIYECNNYKVEVLGYEYTNWRNYSGSASVPAVVIRFYFENGNDVPLYLLESFGIQVFQDGVALDYISLNSDDSEAGNMVKEIKSGAGIYCKMAFQTISGSDTELIITEPNWTGTILCDIPLKR